MNSDHEYQLQIEGDDSWPLFIFAHGAGAPKDSPFMEQMTTLLLERELSVARFEFPYMVERRLSGKKRPPNGQKQLLDTWRAIVGEFSDRRPLFVGGKSMGGRMASMIADEVKATGLVCLGYPFHPPGKPEKTRTQHLEDLLTPALILQGSRDSMGTREDVSAYTLSSMINICWLEDGNHDLKPRVKSGLTHEQHLVKAANEIAAFCQGK